MMRTCIFLNSLFIVTHHIHAQKKEEVVTKHHNIDFTQMHGSIIALSSPPYTLKGHSINISEVDKLFAQSGSQWITLESFNEMEQEINTGQIISKNKIYLEDANNTLSFDSDGGLGLYMRSSQRVFHEAFIHVSTGNISMGGILFGPTQFSFVGHANAESLNINTDNDFGNNHSDYNNSLGTINAFVKLEQIRSISQQVIYNGWHGISIRNISRFFTWPNCTVPRDGCQNGDNLGLVIARVFSFDSNELALMYLEEEKTKR